MRIVTLILAVLYFSTRLFAQEQAVIGQWESHLPLNIGTWVTQSTEEVFYSTGSTIIIIDKSDLGVRFRTKVDGLSDIDIDRIAYDQNSDQLVVIYDNSNIDIVSADGVVNRPDIKDNQIIQGDKSIVSLYISEESIAYLSTAFGLVELDLRSYEFGATIFTDLPINSSTILGDYLYAATEEGVYRVIRDGSVNIKDFSQWQLLDSRNGMPALEEVFNLATFGGQIYASTFDQVLVGSGDFMETKYNAPAGSTVQYLSPNLDYLMIAMREINEFDTEVIFVALDGSELRGGLGCTNRALYGVVDQQGRPWYADEWTSIRYADAIGGSCSRVKYNAPGSDGASNIYAADGEVLVASGGADDNYSYNFTRDGYSSLVDNQWTIYNSSTVDLIEEEEIINIYDVVKHPSQDKVYAASFWRGVYEHDRESGTDTLYDETNSSLRGAVGDLQRLRIAGLAFDQDENLWVSNFLAPEPISILTPDGEWHSLPAPGINTSVTEIAIDDNGYAWIATAGISGGVIVYDIGEDVANTADDRSRYININSSVIKSNQIYSVAADLDGDVWVGTSEGPVVFECGDPFDVPSCQGNIRIVLQDSIPAELLATEQIRAIAVDGANRKWFGSRNGIFVQSPDGETQVARYTAADSPLFDDNINALDYDGSTGKMYISTDAGLQSVRTETTAGSRRHVDTEVYAFPNPVRPDYSGPIAIKGLAQDADVKITDLNGRLVYETTALGGQAIWDGMDYSGRRAATGVYLVFSASAVSFDEVDSYVTKILMVE